MNPLIQLGKVIPVFLVALACFALSPVAQAVNPPPDGGYSNFNTAEGQNALFSLTTGTANTAVGWSSLFSNTGGSFNTATGAGALLFNIADRNTAFGTAALLSNTIGLANTAVGTSALLSNTTGPGNTATGAEALTSNITGEGNTASGFQALTNNTTGDFNAASGFGALLGNTTGGHNVALGIFAGVAQTTGSNNVYIGTNIPGVAGESNACYIASIFGQTSADGVAVFINSNNKLGTATSSKRFKENIKPMAEASEALFSLKPVSFRYREEIDPAGKPQLGLVAEEVEKINPDLVVRDKEGKPYSVRYDQVNAMLLNEFLKEHRKVERQGHKILEQEVTIAQLKSGMETLSATVKEQAAQIQKVTAQLKMSKPALQVVENDQ